MCHVRLSEDYSFLFVMLSADDSLTGRIIRNWHFGPFWLTSRHLWLKCYKVGRWNADLHRTHSTLFIKVKRKERKRRRDFMHFLGSPDFEVGWWPRFLWPILLLCIFAWSTCLFKKGKILTQTFSLGVHLSTSMAQEYLYRPYMLYKCLPISTL